MISGLCFETSALSFSQMVKDAQKIDAEICLSSVWSGIEHLHAHGLEHGDINPPHILSHGVSFVITDFGSCTKKGGMLGLEGGN